MKRDSNLLSYLDIKEGIKIAFSFMTFYRVNLDTDEKPHIRKAVPFVPLVGLAIGIVLYALAFLLAEIGVSSQISALLVAATLFAQTRFLHLDGIADVTDALFGAYTPEDRQRILKDTHVGAFAVIALVLTILAYYLLIETLIDRNFLSALIVFPVLGRLSVVFAAHFAKPSGPGLGASMLGKLKGEEIILVLIQVFITFVILVPAILFNASAVMFISILAAAAIPHLFTKPFGGVNGDVMGASIVLTELLALLSLVQGI